MRWTTWDPYGQKELIEVSNILKLDFYGACIERDTAIQNLQKFTKRYIDVLQY